MLNIRYVIWAMCFLKRKKKKKTNKKETNNQIRHSFFCASMNIASDIMYGLVCLNLNNVDVHTDMTEL